MTRTKPYTKRGLKRLTCFIGGCPNRATTQWQICADGNTYRPLCPAHDVELNTMVMRWAFGDTREPDIQRYRDAALQKEQQP